MINFLCILFICLSMNGIAEDIIDVQGIMQNDCIDENLISFISYMELMKINMTNLTINGTFIQFNNSF